MIARHTIDVLILHVLAEGRGATAKTIARHWGEDVVRVDGWLKKFCDLGICTGHLIGGRYVYQGDQAMIAEYIEKRLAAK